MEKKTFLKGFTIIELLVVISIIGILLGFLTVSYKSVQQRGRDTQRKSDLSQYRNVLENYAGINDSLYPCYPAAITIESGTNLCLLLKTSGLIASCPDDPMNRDPSGPNIYYYYIGNNLAGGNCAPSGTAAATNYVLWTDQIEAGDDVYWEVCSDGRSGTVTSPPTNASCDLP